MKYLVWSEMSICLEHLYFREQQWFMTRKILCLNSVQSSHKELFNHSGVSYVLAFTIRLVEQNWQWFKQMLAIHAFQNAFFSITLKLKWVTAFSATVKGFGSTDFKVTSPLSPPKSFFTDFWVGTELLPKKIQYIYLLFIIIIVVRARCGKQLSGV